MVRGMSCRLESKDGLVWLVELFHTNRAATLSGHGGGVGGREGQEASSGSGAGAQPPIHSTSSEEISESLGLEIIGALTLYQNVEGPKVTAVYIGKPKKRISSGPLI